MLEPGMEMEAFKDALGQILAAFNAHYFLMAKNGGESKPVGFIGAVDNGYRMEPHALWFPWATDRNRLESWLNFLNKIRVTRLAIVIVPEKELNIYKHLERYGVIQRRGTIIRFFEDGQSAAIYQSKD